MSLPINNEEELFELLEYKLHVKDFICGVRVRVYAYTPGYLVVSIFMCMENIVSYILPSHHRHVTSNSHIV